MTSNVIYKFFADFVYKKTGISYPEKDYYRLDSRLNNLITKWECKDVDDLYQRYLNSMTPEMEKFLIDICTNNETYFFRDNKPFDALASDIIPLINKNFNTKNLKIWSCASSTGQEPLSIIMTILEKYGSEYSINFDATDISTKALAKAKSGQYTNLDVQRGMPVQLLVKYFDNLESGDWKAKPEVLNKVTYGEFNLFTGAFPLNKYHVIFCRNVLIYQESKNKNEILESIASSLAPGGFLILGAGESLIGTGTALEQVTLGNCMVFQKPALNKSVA
jgi:chemotaxis protein methyltransferase CheR